MGQLQKRFEQQAQADFLDAPDSTVTWQPGSAPPSSSSTITPAKVRPVQAPRWQMRALTIGAVIIVALLVILVFG
jgi:hypothetical protein